MNKIFLISVFSILTLNVMAQEKIVQTAGRTQLVEFAPKFAELNGYLAPVSSEQVPIANVTFEPRSRNNWHIHKATKGGGQMLIGVAGRGWYQEEGKPAIEILPGTVIHIPANVKHWHGAAADSWFAHLAFEVPGEKTSNEWLEPVTDEEYDKLEQNKETRR